MHNDAIVNNREGREMRECFEKWAIKTATEHGYKYMELVLKREGEGYAMTWVDSTWMGWRAAWELSHEN